MMSTPRRYLCSPSARWALVLVLGCKQPIELPEPQPEPGMSRNMESCPGKNADCADGGTEHRPSTGQDTSSSACPAGYLRVASDTCAPTLTGLDVSPGVLSPELSATELNYRVAVSLATTTLSLKPSAPARAKIRIDGEAVETGTSWRSQELKPGDNPIEITVLESDRPTRTYRLTAVRGAAQQLTWEERRDDELDRFGWAVALSGNTLAVGADQDGHVEAWSGAAYVFAREDDGGWSEQAFLKASNPRPSAAFGSSVALSSDSLVVGAYDGSGATGINGDQDDESAPRSGAAYVFLRTASTWSQQAYLKASNTDEGDLFGGAAAISGNTIVVGAIAEDSQATGIDGDGLDNSAINSGAAYVFVRNGSTWSQQAYLKASNAGEGDAFGSSVAIAGDTLVIGAPYEDGGSTAAAADPSDDSADDSGAVYVFVRSGNNWSQQAYLKPSDAGASDEFGGAVAISGDTIVVGAEAESGGANDVNGDARDNTAARSGAAYVFVRSGNTWSQQAYLKAANVGEGDNLGVAVAIAGERVVAGAYREASDARGIEGEAASDDASAAGAAYLFERRDGSWSQQLYLKANDTQPFDYFGRSVAIDRGTVAVGAPGWGAAGDPSPTQAKDTEFYAGPGAAYVFE